MNGHYKFCFAISPRLKDNRYNQNNHLLRAFYNPYTMLNALDIYCPARKISLALNSDLYHSNVSGKAETFA